MGQPAAPEREIVVDEFLSKCNLMADAENRENPKLWQTCASQLAFKGDYDAAIAFIDEARSLYVGAGDMGAVIRMDEIRAELHYARFNAKWGG